MAKRRRETELVVLEIGNMTLVAEKGPHGYSADRKFLERATNSSFNEEIVLFNGDFDEEPWPYPNWPLDILPENLKLARAYPPLLREFPTHLAIHFRYVHMVGETSFESPEPGSHLEVEVWTVDPDTNVVSNFIYELDRVKIPVLNDAFVLEHAETAMKREVNEVFAGALELDTATLVLDCPNMGTTNHLLRLSKPSAIYIINPQARGDSNPHGFAHDHPVVHTVSHVLHHALQCVDLPQGNLALDYCCTFNGDANKCMPFEDVRSALRMRQLEPNGGILWVTYSLRGVRKEDMRDPISLISQWGNDCGYELTLFYEQIYGKICAVMFKSCCERVVIPLAVSLETKNALETENARLRAENKRLRNALRELID